MKQLQQLSSVVSSGLILQFILLANWSSSSVRATNLDTTLNQQQTSFRRDLSHFNQRCDPNRNCYDCMSIEEGSMCVWDDLSNQCLALEQRNSTRYWFDYLKECKDTEKMCMQNFNEEMGQYTFNFNQLYNGSQLIPQNYFCFFSINLPILDGIEWELAIATRNSSSRSIKIDLETAQSSGRRKRSLQYRKDYNSSPENENSTRRLSFTKRALGDYSAVVNISFFNEHSILDQNLYQSEFKIWLTQKPTVLTSTDRWIFYGAAGFEFLFILALIYGAYFLRKNYKDLLEKESQIATDKNNADGAKISIASQPLKDLRSSRNFDVSRQETKINDDTVNLAGRYTIEKGRQSKQSSILDFEPSRQISVNNYKSRDRNGGNRLKNSAYSSQGHASAILNEDSRGIANSSQFNIDDADLKTVNNQNVLSNVAPSLHVRPESGMLRSHDLKGSENNYFNHYGLGAAEQESGAMVPGMALEVQDLIREENLSYIETAKKVTKQRRQELELESQKQDDTAILLQPYLTLLEGENVDVDALRKKLQKEAKGDFRKHLKQAMKSAQELKKQTQEIELQRQMRLTVDEMEEQEKKLKEVRSQYKTQMHKIRQAQIGMRPVTDLATLEQISQDHLESARKEPPPVRLPPRPQLSLASREPKSGQYSREPKSGQYTREPKSGAFASKQSAADSQKRYDTQNSELQLKDPLQLIEQDLLE